MILLLNKENCALSWFYHKFSSFIKFAPDHSVHCSVLMYTQQEEENKSQTDTFLFIYRYFQLSSSCIPSKS
jgi:hypothetical protein